MRLNNYISEAVYSYDSFEVIRQVYDNSFPFLRELMRSFRIDLNTPMFYSGRSSKEIWFKRDIRTDRYPKDTPQYTHDFIDSVFYNNFGFRARSNSIFCTGKRREASNYGSAVYGIFPAGNNYKFIWSSNITDLYSEVVDSGEFNFMGQETADIVYEITEYDDDLKEDVTIELEEQFDSENDLDDFEDESEWEDAKQEYVGDHFNETLESRAWDKAEELRNDQESEFERQIVRSYNLGDLKKAIMSGNEIMLSGKSYIAVRYDFLPFILRYMQVHGPKKPTIDLFREAMQGADFKNYPSVGHMPKPRINKELASILDISDLKK